MQQKIATKQIKEAAAKLGFHKIGIAPAQKLPYSNYLKEWLANGFFEDMQWMENYLEKRLDIFKLYPLAKSVIAVAHNYYTDHQHSSRQDIAKISRYAWGKDYHKLVKKKLKKLLYQIKEIDPEIEGSIYVDTAPIQDKLWAKAAGIGWQGKNTNIITKEYGSWIFLGELVINKELQYDTPIKDYCGNCSKCIDACPTKALTPYKLDARRCLSYLTIEYWDKPIPAIFQNKMNNWVFGCDICQDVCPWNRMAKETDESSYKPDIENISPKLSDLESLSEEDFKKRFKKSPVYRAKYYNFIRNIKTILK